MRKGRVVHTYDKKTFERHKGYGYGKQLAMEHVNNKTTQVAGGTQPRRFGAGAGSQASMSHAAGYLKGKQSANHKDIGRKVAIGVGAAAAGVGGYKAYKHFQGRKHGDRDYSRPKVKRSSRAKIAR